jgi:S1-C subfamily serine protease
MKLGQVPIFGAYVGKVAPGSPAHRAGLQPGDIITQLHVRPIQNAADVEKALEVVKRGDIVDVAFSRGNQNLRSRTAV